MSSKWRRGLIGYACLYAIAAGWYLVARFVDTHRVRFLWEFSTILGVQLHDIALGLLVLHAWLVTMGIAIGQQTKE